MNILYTVFSFNTGGIEKLLIDIINSWNDIENYNLFLCIINEDYDEKLIKLINNNKNIKIILLNRPKGNRNFKFILEYMNIVIKYKIDIIHCQSINVVKFSSIIKLLCPKIKIFHTIHDTKIYSNLKWSDIIFDKIITKKIIAISNAVKQEILLKNIRAEKVELIYNGIDLNRFNVVEKSNSDEIRIGCVARLIPKKKGQDILIRAIRIVKESYPNIKCYFAGEAPKGKEYYLDDLKKLVRELGLEDNIIFYGNINEISNFLNMIDVFVLPSRYEGFGIALIEAMACNLPVISSNLDGPKEIIKDGVYGSLFDKGNYKELAIQIINIINGDKKNNNRKYVEEKFTIENMIEKLQEIYCN